MDPPVFWLAEPDDPECDPGFLFFASAQNGSIEGMEEALRKKPEVFVLTDGEGKTALHIAAASFVPESIIAVQWLLEKGLPWCGRDRSDRIPEDLARMYNHESRVTLLRNWAVEFEYKVYYLSNHEEENQDDGIPFGDIVRSVRLIGDKENVDFCNWATVKYVNPLGAPEDEVALITGFDATGVMMEWERPIMRETARLLLDGMPKAALRILNIGFGIGMIDTYFQDAQPAEHVIIEAHPTCLAWMRHKGWYDRPGVRILEGRWQDFLPSTSKSPEIGIGKFDIVYFDTFQEGYHGHVAFIKNVPGLLRGPDSRFSYFNGHGRGGESMYQVFMEVERFHLNDLGLSVKFFPVRVDPDTMWMNLLDLDKGVKPGQKIPYTIPICALAPTVPRRIVSNV